jgi:DNA-binding response OmpR family regulator
MPNLDGVEALRQIKDYDADAKAIMITAAGQQNKVIESLKLGAEVFITKPFDPNDIVKNMDMLTQKK